MVLLFVDESTDKQSRHSIKQNQRVERQGRHCTVDHHEAHVFYHAIDGVAQKQPLLQGRVLVHGIKYRRHVHQKQGEQVIKIRGVAEKDEHSGENKPDADVEQDKARNGIN